MNKDEVQTAREIFQGCWLYTSGQREFTSKDVLFEISRKGDYHLSTAQKVIRQMVKEGKLAKSGGQRYKVSRGAAHWLSRPWV